MANKIYFITLEVKNMAKVKAFALAALAVMTIGMAATTEAAKPVGTSYDFFV